MDAPLKKWFNNLASGKGLCCDFAEGRRVDDVDWQSSGGHYQVRVDGQWIEVPDDAIVTEPNKFGLSVVWPYDGGDGKLRIRCFLPGAGG